MVTGKPGCACSESRCIACVMPARKKASAASLLPWRYVVATSSSAFGTANVANSSGNTGFKERRSQT